MSPWDPQTLRTRRLVIRPLGVSDLPGVYRYARSYPSEHFGSWLESNDPDSVARYIAETVSRYGRSTRCDLGICLRRAEFGFDAMDLVGGIAFRQVWLLPPTVEVGWVLHPDVGGHGLAGEALSVMLQHLWTAWPELARVEVRVGAMDQRVRTILEEQGAKEPFQDPCKQHLWQ